MYDITRQLKDKSIFDDMSFPRLVSYPRTGSHWLRIMLEVHLGMPSYVQSFFDPSPTQCWGFHIHNRLIEEPHHTEGPVVGLKNVIYLYRDPIDTIFSQLRYEKKLSPSWNGEENERLSQDVKKISQEYHAHLKRWLFNNDDVDNFMSLTYEDLKGDPVGKLMAISTFLGAGGTVDTASEAVRKCDKSLTKKLTPHDNNALNDQSLNRPDQYTDQKQLFTARYGNKIVEKFKSVYHVK